MTNEFCALLPASLSLSSVEKNPPPQDSLPFFLLLFLSPFFGVGGRGGGWGGEREGLSGDLSNRSD